VQEFYERVAHKEGTESEEAVKHPRRSPRCCRRP
jgi:hypothetical protein